MSTLIQENLKTMSSREIADLVGKRHDNVKRLIDNLTDKGVIRHPQIEDVRNHQEQLVKTYIFSGEQGKRDSIVVVAQLSPEFTAKLVDRWAELEQQVNQSQPVIALPDFTNPVEAARAFADQYEAKQIAQEQLAIAQPKAAALDFISSAVNSLNARDTAKTLGVQPQKFNKWCITHNWMYRDSKDKLQMCSNRLQQGFMEQRNVTYYNSNGDVCATTQPMFTAKRLTRLASIFSIVHEVA